MQEKRLPKLLISISAVYILSQVALISLYGRDFFLIFVSFGIFIAALVFTAALSVVSPGRPIIESVSMRRAMRSKEDQARMLQQGYVIDDEFLGKGTKAKPRPSVMSDAPFTEVPLLELPAGTQDSEETKEVALRLSSSMTTPQSARELKLERELLAQAPMFGGLEKMAAMLKNIDDKKLSAMLKSMNYSDVDPGEVRQAVQSLMGLKEEGTLEALNQGSMKPKVSLDTEGFYDYIRRCMKGDDMESRREAPAVIDYGVRLAVGTDGKAEGFSPRALKIMKGVHTAYGEMKCFTCSAFDVSRNQCGKLQLQVETTDVCDSWEPGSGRFRR